MEIGSLTSGLLGTLPDRAAQRVETQELKVKQATEQQDDKQLKQACEDFESLLIYKMLESMRKTVPKNELFGESMGEEIFKGMYDEELSKQMAASGGIGLAQVLYQQLSPKGDVYSVEELKAAEVSGAVPVPREQESKDE